MHKIPYTSQAFAHESSKFRGRGKREEERQERHKKNTSEEVNQGLPSTAQVKKEGVYKTSKTKIFFVASIILKVEINHTSVATTAKTKIQQFYQHSLQHRLRMQHFWVALFFEERRHRQELFPSSTSFGDGWGATAAVCAANTVSQARLLKVWARHTVKIEGIDRKSRALKFRNKVKVLLGYIPN